MDKKKWGEPAPKWLRDADMFNGWYYRFTREDYDKCRGLSGIVTPLHTCEVVEELHRRGVKVIFYINVSTYPSISRRKEIIEMQKPHEHNEEYGFILESPFCNTVNLDLENRLRNWVWVDRRNQSYLERKSADSGGYDDDLGFEGVYYQDGKWDGWKRVCPNAIGLREATLEGVKKLMDMGADGIFLDSWEYDDERHKTTHRCWADKFKGHQHAQPEWDFERAGLAITQGIYRLVKSYGKDNVVWINGGASKPQSLKYVDAQMMESLICTHVSTRRWHTFSQVQEMVRPKGEAIKAGKVISPLSYLGYTSHGVREDAFYCFAAARLLGLCWADWFTMGEDSRARQLYRIRLRGTRSEMLEHNGVYYRLFTNGVVALNPTPDDRELTIKTGITTPLRELATNRRYVAHNESRGWTLNTTELKAIIPAESGRVFIEGFAR